MGGGGGRGGSKKGGGMGKGEGGGVACWGGDGGGSSMGGDACLSQEREVRGGGIGQIGRGVPEVGNLEAIERANGQKLNKKRRKKSISAIGVTEKPSIKEVGVKRSDVDGGDAM